MKKALSLILALVLVLGLSVTALAAEHKVFQSTGAITIDGKVDDWSAPVLTGNRDTTNWANNAAHNWDVYNGGNIVDGQTYDVYLTTDADYTYVALKINKVLTEPTYPVGSSANLLGATDTHDAAPYVPQFTFAIGAYDLAKYTANGGYENNTNPNSIKAMVSAWRVGLVDDGGNYTKVNKCVTSWVTGGEMADYTLTDDDYAIVYDDANDTYIYEVRVPHSATNITGETGAVALDLDFATPDKYGTGLVRYITGTLSAEIYDGWWTQSWGIHPSHVSSHLYYTNPTKECKHIVVETVNNYVDDTVAEFSGNINIDGKVSVSEWGEPVVVTSPEHNQATWGNYWRYDPGAVRAGQAAKLYMTNDKENIYLAFTMDKNHLDSTCTDAGNLWNAAHFGFSIAKYNEESTVPIIDFNNNKHEQYTAFRIGLVNGVKGQQVLTHGIDPVELPEENYAVSYDEETMTYTYEVKLPISMTNINVQETRDVAISVAAAGINYGSGANLYQITTGFNAAVSNVCPADGSCYMLHKGNALKITLNDTRKKIDTFVKDTAPAIKEAVKLDGVITDKEWGGSAVVSTTPGHCQATWGNFWEFDPSSVNPEQNAKLYVTNDADYLYIGATLDEADLDTTCKNVSELYKAAHFNFSVSGYDETNTVKRIPFEGKDYEQYTGFMMGLVNGKPASYTFTQGHAAWELPAEDYAIKYDEATRTYTYEARIPFAKMNVTTDKVAISASIGAPYTKGDGANRYNLTTGSATCGGAGNWAHLNNALVFRLLTNPNTGDAMNLFVAIGVIVVAAAGVFVAVKAKRRNHN